MTNMLLVTIMYVLLRHTGYGICGPDKKAARIITHQPSQRISYYYCSILAIIMALLSEKKRRLVSEGGLFLEISGHADGDRRGPVST